MGLSILRVRSPLLVGHFIHKRFKCDDIADSTQYDLVRPLVRVCGSHRSESEDDYRVPFIHKFTWKNTIVFRAYYDTTR